MAPQELMELAIEKARQGVAAGQSPFGCAVFWQGAVVACEHNRVLETTDITAHAEVTALRTACREAGEILLPGAIVATTCEPCPMCMAALHWARVEVVYFGATIDDAGRAGFNELLLPAAEVIRLGGSAVKLVPGILTEQCCELFAVWNTRTDRQAY
jgi:tRNA(Arg) A34 adenosine deaminase TadA